MTTRAFFKVCLVLIFLNTIVEKKHTLNPEITLLYQFHTQKALFKVPKICNIIFWIENDAPPPFGTFPKIHPTWRSHPSLSHGAMHHFSHFNQLQNCIEIFSWLQKICHM